MAYKRKRSDMDSSPASSSTSSTDSRNESPSPTPQRYAFDFRIEAPVRDVWNDFMQKNEFDSGASGRTRKRYRDNRPDDAAVYSSTFRKLFAARRQPAFYSASCVHSPHSPPPDAMELSEPSAAQSKEQQQQQQPRSQASLHRFFHIRSAPSSNIMPVVSEDALHDSPLCEDCNGPLTSDGPEDDTAMTDDGLKTYGSPQNRSCRSCRRRVCDHCCTVGPGMSRSCLQCWRT